MTNWQQSFEDQQCLQRIQECLRLLESATIDGLLPNEAENFTRLLKVLKVLEARITGIDPDLFSLNTWGNLGSWLTYCLNYIREYNQSRNPGHLHSANSVLDEVLNILRPLDASSSTDVVKATTDAAHTFQKKIIDDLARVQTRGMEVKAQAESLANEVVLAKARLDENNQVIEQQKGRLDQSIAAYQLQFSQSESNRANEFATVTRKMLEDFAIQSKEFSTSFTEYAAARQAEHKKLIQEFDERSNEHMKFLEKRKSEVNEIFGAIGVSSLSGHFKTTADNDAKAADQLRLLALVLMTAMIAIGGFAFYHSLNHPGLDWKVFAFRLGTTIIIAVPAFYAAQESARHRDRERRNRKLHLELASIDAYLVLLPEPKRHELKEKLTEKFFGRPDAVDNSDEVSKLALFELVGSVVKNLTKPK